MTPHGCDRGKLADVIAGLVPAISIRMAQNPTIGMAGEKSSHDRVGCREFYPCYARIR